MKEKFLSLKVINAFCMIILICACAMTFKASANAADYVVSKLKLGSSLDITQAADVLNDKNNYYCQVTIPSDGILTLTGNEASHITYYLCDSKKNILNTYLIYLNVSNDIEDNNKSNHYLKQGVYYLKITGISTPDKAIISSSFNANPTVKTGATATIYSRNIDSYYIKYKADKTGYVTLWALNSDTSGYITICNKSKKAISEKQWIWGDASSNYPKQSFGVKKGTVYYFKMDISDTFTYKVRSTAVTDNSGSKKSSAHNIAANKTVKGLIVAGNATADWYKLTVTSKHKLKFFLDGEGNGNAKITMTDKNGKNYGIINAFISSDELSLYTSSNKIPKGTYYIKVVRGNALSNGMYSIKWK